MAKETLRFLILDSEQANFTPPKNGLLSFQRDEMRYFDVNNFEVKLRCGNLFSNGKTLFSGINITANSDAQ
jgi:hypothetical protein